MLGSLYTFSLWKEKEYQRAFEEAFAVPAPSKDVNWTVNKGVVRDWGIYVTDIQNYSSGAVPIRGTEWVYTRSIKDKDMYALNAEFFSNLTNGWFRSSTWASEDESVWVDGRYYMVNVIIPMGVSNYTQGYLKILDNKIRVVYFGMQTSDEAYITARPPYPDAELNYPFNVEYRVFISDIVPVRDIIKGLNRSSP